MFVKVISICALLVGIGGLLMSLARTGPEEAAANLSRWIAWFQIPKIQGTLKTIFAEVARSWSWRFIFVCLVALGCLGIIWSLKGPEAVTPLAPAVPPAGPPN